jgi:hypothetical protein
LIRTSASGQRQQVATAPPTRPRTSRRSMPAVGFLQPSAGLPQHQSAPRRRPSPRANPEMF